MNTISKLLILLVSTTLAACAPPQSERTVSQEKLTNVVGLEDCTAIKYNYSGWKSDALVIRCPNSSVTTTTRQGKSTQINTVVDQEPLTNVIGLQDCTETRYAYSWIRSDTIVIRCSSKQQ